MKLKFSTYNYCQIIHIYIYINHIYPLYNLKIKHFTQIFTYIKKNQILTHIYISIYILHLLSTMKNIVDACFGHWFYKGLLSWEITLGTASVKLS